MLYLKTHFYENDWVMRLIFDSSLVLIATCSASTFYVACQRELFRTWADSIKYLPFLMSLGVGVSLNNARAAFEGFFGKNSEFVRTPKFGVSGNQNGKLHAKAGRQRLNPKRIQAWCELFLAFYLTTCIVYSAVNKFWLGIFFLCLFAVGYYYVALLTFYGQYQASRAAESAEPAPGHPSQHAAITASNLRAYAPVRTNGELTKSLS